MKILYFSRYYTSHDRRFLSALAETSHRVTFLQLENSDRVTEDRAIPDGIHRVCLEEKGRAFQWRHVPAMTDKLQAVLQEIKPDVVHAGPLQSAAYLAARSGFQPLVSMSWGSDLLLDADRNQWMHRVTRYTLNRTTVLVGDCEAVREKAEHFSFDPNRTVLFPWGVDLKTFFPDRNVTLRASLGWQDAFVVLSLRNWESVYGVDVLARGFARAAAEEPALRLMMLGGGSQERLLRQIFEQAGVSHQVLFAGQVSQNDLPAYHRAADLYVSASHSDGSSVSLMEALACSLPCLVSDIPGNREWLSGSSAGWLFADGDDQALTRGILDAYQQRTELTGVRFAARALAEQRANWQKNFKNLLRAYDLAFELTINKSLESGRAS